MPFLRVATAGAITVDGHCVLRAQAPSARSRLTMAGQMRRPLERNLPSMNLAQVEPLDVSIADAAAFLGCGERFVSRLIAEGRLKSFKLGKQRRITLKSLHALRREMSGEAKPCASSQAFRFR